jgi:hypothetical protein
MYRAMAVVGALNDMQCASCIRALHGERANSSGFYDLMIRSGSRRRWLKMRQGG